VTLTPPPTSLPMPQNCTPLLIENAKNFPFPENCGYAKDSCELQNDGYHSITSSTVSLVKSSPLPGRLYVKVAFRLTGSNAGVMFDIRAQSGISSQLVTLIKPASSISSTLCATLDVRKAFHTPSVRPQVRRRWIARLRIRGSRHRQETSKTGPTKCH
jgi:hypothetical protein